MAGIFSGVSEEVGSHPLIRTRPMIRVVRLGQRLPSIQRMAWNATLAAARTIGATVNGNSVVVPDDVHQARNSHCQTCDHRRPSDNRCMLCGCGLAGHVIDKTRLAAEQCPLMPPKWGQYVGKEQK